jgi:hypothetical protein
MELDLRSRILLAGFLSGLWVTAPKVQNPAGTRIETRAWFSG